ncbi:hypothetical protein BV22DRAFT_1039299 [Leucogyrophana mollusca]|uniref:Uncharacterized protein n=1 Tax=Leucogyrophana mollusca TaxID=85980 RepID=A0ACB8B6X6_9AGAM|nr:hypothetical protein BV22DRAFT_1039299 [Leucogyrophana mollusca]
MRSFSTLSLLFTAALSAFTSAAPTGPADVTAIGGKLTSAVGAVGAVPKLGGAVQERDQSPASVAVIFTTLQDKVLPLTDKFTYITPANATAANITPIIVEIKGCLLTATASLKLLVGAELSVILAPVEGEVALTVAAVGQLVGGVLCILFTAIGCLLKVVVSDVRAVVLPLRIILLRNPPWEKKPP